MYDGQSSRILISVQALYEYRKGGYSEIDPCSLISHSGMRILNQLFSNPLIADLPDYKKTFKSVMESYSVEEREAIIKCADEFEFDVLIDVIGELFPRERTHRPER